LVFNECKKIDYSPSAESFHRTEQSSNCKVKSDPKDSRMSKQSG